MKANAHGKVWLAEDDAVAISVGMILFHQLG
jgi:hypothetical protein